MPLNKETKPNQTEKSEFLLQSYYYVHFQINTFGKGMNPLISPVMG